MLSIRYTGVFASSPLLCQKVFETVSLHPDPLHSSDHKQKSSGRVPKGNLFETPLVPAWPIRLKRLSSLD